MAYKKIIDPKTPVTHPPCVHLRSKEMYVTGQIDPDHPDEAKEHYCWCNLTQHVLGPDDAGVDRHTCAPGRGCYRDTR